MKILWLSHLVPYPPKGGVLQRSYNLVRETAKHHDVTLLAFIQSDLIKSRLSNKKDGLEEAYQHLNTYCDHIEFINIPCEKHRFGKYLLALRSLFTSDPYSINWLKSPAMHATITKLLQHTDFDCIHFDTISLAPYSGLFPDTPKALDHHNIESHMMLRRAEQENSFFKRAYYKQEGKKLLKYEKNNCSKFDLQITCSSLDSERLIEIDNSLVTTVIPNGVDISFFTPRPENRKDNHLIFAGSLSWYPNKEAMLFFAHEIWPLLKNQLPEVVMNIVGSSPPGELLDIAVSDPQLKIHGYVDDVRDYISSAAIYVCPIRDGGGTKLKILDSFSMGMPTIAHPSACEGIDITEGTNVILASSAKEFADAITMLLSRPDMQRKMAKQARKLVGEKYDFSQIGLKLSSEYKKLI